MAEEKNDAEIVISVSHVSKDFVLPHQRKQSVKSMFLGIFRLHKRALQKQHALHDIDFEVHKGEFFGIVGRNGGGKSTLLKVLAGIYTPTTGITKTVGKLVPFIELGVGFNPELTGRQNVYLNGALLGFSTKEIDKRYDSIVEFAELEEFMDQKLKNYSSGMQVRLAFSVAVRADADILLVDEVLAVGDADFQRKCFEYFKSLKKNKKTVVFVSHNMDAVREYCDRALLINKSKVTILGKPEKVAQEYFRLFNNSAQRNDGSDKPSDRWGNGWAQYKDVKCQVTDDTIRITLKVHATRDIDDVVYGVRIRNSAGTEIFGTNSVIEGLRSLHLKEGEETTIVWETANILSNGVYYIDPALVVGDGATVCDWWDEAQKIEIFKEITTTYPISPPIKINVGNLKKGA
jgi:ABC-2 type transport system ATP-binding protein